MQQLQKLEHLLLWDMIWKKWHDVHAHIWYILHTYIHTRFLIQSSSVHEVGTQGFCSKSRILYTECAGAKVDGVVARAAFVAITFIMGDLWCTCTISLHLSRRGFFFSLLILFSLSPCCVPWWGSHTHNHIYRFTQDFFKQNLSH